MCAGNETTGKNRSFKSERRNVLDMIRIHKKPHPSTSNKDTQYLSPVVSNFEGNEGDYHNYHYSPEVDELR